MTKIHQSIKRIPMYILKNPNVPIRTILNELKTSFETFSHTEGQVLEHFSVIHAETKDDQFLLVSSLLKNLLDEIENQGVPLNQICYIGTGYHSGKDKVFSPNIIEGEGQFFAEIMENGTITRYPLEQELIKEIVKTTDILSFKITPRSKKYVIFTKRGVNINEYPLTEHYLKKYEKILEKRYEVKKNLAKWFEIAQVRNSRIFTAKVKIMCPYRAQVPRFAVDKNQRYSSIDCTSLIVRDSFPNIYYILGILNSELVESFLFATAKKLDARKIELYPKTLSEIPLKIPQTSEEELLYKEIIKITKSICKILDSLKITPESHQILLKYGKRGLFRINKDTHGLLKLLETLDMCVYQLYGMETKIEILKNEINILKF